METIGQGAADLVRFGTFEVNLRTGELRKRGIRIALQEQPLRVLAALLERAGEVVGREDLCRRLWPHGTFVDFEHSLNAAVRRLRTTLGDEAEIPRFIETVHKRGYRFIALNDAFAHATAASARPAFPATIAHIVRKRARLAVVPFGPADGFADGLTEEAITQLAQACPRSIGVIARTSVGRVRRDGDRLRITAQLIESQEETHLWAKTFDRVMTDALTLQTEVASEIARAVTAALSPARRSAV